MAASSQVRPGATNAVKDGTRDVAKYPRKRCNQRCGKDAAKMERNFKPLAGTLQRKKLGHTERDASRTSQTTARTDSWTPHSDGITTERAAHTSQTHMDPDASPFQLNLFSASQGWCSGSEPSSSRLLRSKAKRCAASPPIVLRNSLAPIRPSSVK